MTPWIVALCATLFAILCLEVSFIVEWWRNKK